MVSLSSDFFIDCCNMKPLERNDSHSVWLVTSWVRGREEKEREKTTTVENRETFALWFIDCVVCMYMLQPSGGLSSLTGDQLFFWVFFWFSLGLKADNVRKRNNSCWTKKIKIETISNCIWWLTNDRSSSDAIGWSPRSDPSSFFFFFFWCNAHQVFCRHFFIV